MEKYLEKLILSDVKGDAAAIQELAIQILTAARVNETFQYVQIFPNQTLVIYTTARIVMVKAEINKPFYWGYVWRDVYGAIPRPFREHASDFFPCVHRKFISLVQKVLLDYTRVSKRGRWFRYESRPWWQSHYFEE